jgi:hypothetical protein
VGISIVSSNYEESVWQTDYFGDRGKFWMMNFRVRDLDKILNKAKFS